MQEGLTMDSEEFSEYSDHWDNKQAQYLAKQKLKKTNPNPDMFKIEPEKPEKPDTEGVIDSSEFLNSLTKIEKVKAVTAKDGATWIFTISILGKTERIIISNRDLMKGSWIFEDLFKSRFGFFLPWELTQKPKKGQPNMWKRFQSYIEQICVEIEPTESTEWAECDMLLDVIAGFQVLEDGEVWADKNRAPNTLYKKEAKGRTYYVLKSADMLSLISEKRLTSTHMKIGDTMNQRGFKRKGNPACRVGKKIVNPAWWFTEECLIEHGLNSGASKVPHVMEELL
jgi:hypothetical protein